MMGLDKMLASMIGIGPDQLQDMARGMATAAQEGVELLRNISDQNNKILARLERLENGDGNNHN